MYTTCIIWLAFVPIYFTTSNHVALNLTTMCVSISLSATVTLACLFTPKLYIILLHPEKNVRQSMMPQHKYGAAAANNTSTLLTAATAARVESATQSEGMSQGMQTITPSSQFYVQHNPRLCPRVCKLLSANSLFSALYPLHYPRTLQIYLSASKCSSPLECLSASAYKCLNNAPLSICIASNSPLD